VELRSRFSFIALAVTSALSVALLNLPSQYQGMATVGPKVIKHVVVIYQENHTFDETLGRVCQVRIKPCDGHTGVVTLKNGTTVSMRQSPDIVPRVDHSVNSQKIAIDNGAMDGWAGLAGCSAAQNYPCLTYYSANQIPNLAALANTYAVSDRTFSMTDSPSWGGHLYAVAASTDGFTGDNPLPVNGAKSSPGWGCDSNKTSAWWNSKIKKYTQQPSCIPDFTLNPTKYPFGGAFRKTPVKHVNTIFDRLRAANLTWKVYGQADPAGFGYTWSICPSFATCLYTGVRRNLVPTANALRDAATNQLPAYSVLTPSESSAQANGDVETSQHNGLSMLGGDNWIGKVVRAIESGPAAASTVIFITYDDCGCFYDHVAPPKNPDGTRQGPRVPMVIVNPYVRRGYTDRHNASYSSILAFTEHVFNLRPLTSNDAQAYDYSNSFDFNQTPIIPTRMVQRKVPAGITKYIKDNPPDPDDPS
jgi:phospholipase C